MNSKTTLLELLKAGVTVEFPDGTYLKGLPEDNYIEIGIHCCTRGLWILNEEDLEKAIKDLDSIKKDEY